MLGGLPSSKARRLAGAAALVGVVLVTIVQARHIGLDFWTRYAAGELVSEGRSPYDEDLVVQRIFELGYFNHLPFYDSPPVAVLCRFLALLPLRASYLFLTALSFGSCVLIGRVLGGRDRTLWLLASVGLVVFTPARFTIVFGQIDVVVMAIAIYVGGRWPVVALLKPQTVGTTVATLFARRFHRQRWQVVPEVVLSAVVVVGAAVLLASSAGWVDWVQAVQSRDDDPTNVWPWALSLAGLAVLAWGVSRQRRRGPGAPPVDVLCVSACAATFLAAWGNWNPQWFLCLAFPLAALLLGVHRGELHLRGHEAALLTVATAAAGGEGMFSAIFFGVDRVVVPWAIFGGFLLALVLWGYLAPRLALLVWLLNGAIAAARISQEQRVGVGMAIAIALLYLTFTLRPRPIDVPSPVEAHLEAPRGARVGGPVHERAEGTMPGPQADG